MPIFSHLTYKCLNLVISDPFADGWLWNEAERICHYREMYNCQTDDNDLKAFKDTIHRHWTQAQNDDRNKNLSVDEFIDMMEKEIKDIAEKCGFEIDYDINEQSAMTLEEHNLVNKTMENLMKSLGK